MHRGILIDPEQRAFTQMDVEDDFRLIWRPGDRWNADLLSPERVIGGRHDPPLRFDEA
jgi:hypothetical protein